jgi:hypothetical protein
VIALGTGINARGECVNKRYRFFLNISRRNAVDTMARDFVSVSDGFAY